MDWTSIISFLQKAGYSQEHLATACGCAQATISDLARGKTKRPNFELGKKLEALHKKAATPKPAKKREVSNG